MDSKRAWTVWGVGVFAYLIAVTQRTSFGVVGLEATARFSASASALSAFTVIQLLVYAGLQIPVGVLVDRFGPRVMIATGAALMTVGQIQLAAATSVPGGVVGRIFVGAGDAMTFISVIRLIPAWFPSRRVPLLTQLTGQLGQFGQLISIAPFALVLHAWGWSPAFLGLAGLGLVACVLSTAALRNAPEMSGPAVELAGIKETAEDLARAWQQPGTRLGMWSHFATQFAGNVFVMTWGYPFLVSGQGLDPTEASVLLSLFVVVGIICGPLLGGWVGRHPMRRSTMVLAVTFAITAAWLSVILYPGPAPLWLLVVLVLILALGGPASMIGFDFARTFNPSRRIGTATGIVNVGGFIAALITMYVVGLILDLLKNSGFSGGNLYSLDSFRIALSFQFIVLAIGVGAVIGMRNQVRRRMALAGETVPPLRQALADNARRRAQYRSELRAGRLAGRDTAGRDTAGKHDGGPAGQD
ncbi:sugar phosphate permease [Arthrobacter silviterrae]|uniref:Lysosomal dipeptide transporter MFSD1 n=1 Tax=Arthrobacter silviterrae TaxID=2026658 RepID=A0ABX0DER6_9MICC|nr:MFS transporter [Arthrobacter silviterrae]MDQ0275831.1 sugar phosphate permease [Arthrobacter silviterrae]NGN85133.1 MFS transporter [Arthrobacter silviterrae]